MAGHQSLFQQCYEAHNDDKERLLMCISDNVERMSDQTTVDVHRWLLVLSGSLVFFMQGGFAMVCAGAVRKKNVNNTLLKNLLDAMGAALAFATFGYAFAYGEQGNSFIGTSNFFLSGNIDAATFFFQYGCCAAAATIVAGTLAERCQMVAYICYSIFLTGFIYPVAAHVIWSEIGFLSHFNSSPLLGSGMIDFSGSGVVHVTGGSVALCATIVLGPRRGRFTDADGKLKKKPGLSKGHSVAFQAIGTFILWFGWYGFNAGSSLLRASENSGQVAVIAVVNTTLAAAAGGITALFVDGKIAEQRDGEFHLDIVRAMNGTLAGLVAITGSCAVIDHWSAVICGIFAGALYLWISDLLLRLHIDDAIDAIPVHLANGMLGVIWTGFFVKPDLQLKAYGNERHTGLFYGNRDANLLGCQVIGLLFILAWTFGTMYPFFRLIDHIGWFRVNELDEIVGLDASYNDEELNEDRSEEDKKEREEAYKKRLEEIQVVRRKKTYKQVLQLPWGTLDLDSSNETGSHSGYHDSKHGNLSLTQTLPTVNESEKDGCSSEASNSNKVQSKSSAKKKTSRKTDEFIGGTHISRQELLSVLALYE